VENAAGIASHTPVPGVTLYPNPNPGDLLHVTCNLQVPMEMRILDLTGKKVLEATYHGKTVIDTGTLLPGTYLVIHSGRDDIFREKLIIF
jgi:hypothetical protein